MAAYAKLIPPAEVLEEELAERIEQKLRDAITERVLREAHVDGQVAAAVAAIETPDSIALAAGVKELFKTAPDAQWRDHIESVANELAAADDDSEAAS
jgi:hypothetical protein